MVRVAEYPEPQIAKAQSVPVTWLKTIPDDVHLTNGKIF
jgi:hypothetical protein